MSKFEGYFFDNVPVYDQLMAKWWDQYYPNTPPLSPLFLTRYGSVVTDGEHPVALQYIYPAGDSQVVWLGFTIRDPKLSPLRAGRALQVLFETSEKAILSMGRSLVITNFESPSLQRIAVKRGYSGGMNTKEYWRNLYGGSSTVNNGSGQRSSE